ncbi:MAG: hypothetical protein IJA96_00635 [Alistipes sp.]|nr:hypothetical protein [Alistipes sp.]
MMMKKCLIMYFFLCLLNSNAFAADRDASKYPSDFSMTEHKINSFNEITPSPKVYNFHDVVQHISKTSYRVTDIDYDDNVNIAHEKPINKKSEVVRNHYAKLAHTVDELNLVNYQCDTIQIYDFWSEWSVGDVYNSPHSNYHLDFKCRKGLYELVDYKLEPKHFDEEYVNEKTRAVYEEIRKKNYPNLDALPFTYDWEMLRYNCWDDQKMIRNFGKTTDVCETLIRIIIMDNRIVYCDKWDW